MGKSGKSKAIDNVKLKKAGKPAFALLTKPMRTIERSRQSQSHSSKVSQHRKNNNWNQFNAEANSMRERLEKKSSLLLTNALKLAPSLLPPPTTIDTKQDQIQEVYFQQTDELLAGENQTATSFPPSQTVDKSHRVVDNSHQSFKALFMDEEDEINFNVAPPRFLYETSAGSLTP